MLPKSEVEQIEILPNTHAKTLDSSVINVKIDTHAPKVRTNRIQSNYQEGRRKTTIKTQGCDPVAMEEKSMEMKDILNTAKEEFIRSIAIIPSQIKYRNEKTLSKTIRSLELFNPFFNRNQTIVNVCLLKIGRIWCKRTGTLYKLG